MVNVRDGGWVDLRRYRYQVEGCRNYGKGVRGLRAGGMGKGCKDLCGQIEEQGRETVAIDVCGYYSVSTDLNCCFSRFNWNWLYNSWKGSCMATSQREGPTSVLVSGSWCVLQGPYSGRTRYWCSTRPLPMWTWSKFPDIVLWHGILPLFHFCSLVTKPPGCTTARGHDDAIFIPVAIKMTSALSSNGFIGQVIHAET